MSNLTIYEKQSIQAENIFNLKGIKSFDDIINKAELSSKISNLSAWNTPRLLYLATLYTTRENVVAFASKYYGFGKSKAYDFVKVGEFVQDSGVGSIFQNLESGLDFTNIYTLHTFIIKERAKANKIWDKLTAKEKDDITAIIYPKTTFKSLSKDKDRQNKVKEFFLTTEITDSIQKMLDDGIITYDMTIQQAKDFYSGKDLTSQATAQATAQADGQADGQADRQKLSITEILNKTLELCNLNGFTIQDLINHFNSINKWLKLVNIKLSKKGKNKGGLTAFIFTF